MRVLLIDHHDSFTWNLAHLLAAVTGDLPEVVAHDDARLLDWDWDAVDATVLSPGPGNPTVATDARYSAEALAPGRPPVLGVCLGMQLIAAHAGGTITRAPEPRHGRVSNVRHDGTGLFAGLPAPLSVVRYHSLCWAGGGEAVEATAWAEDGVVMALRHRTLPQWGVQFHPESIATDGGHALVANFLAKAHRRRPNVPPVRPALPVAIDTLPPTLVRRLAATPDPDALYARTCAAPAVWLDGAAAGTRFTVMGDASGPLAYTVSYRAGGELVVTRRGATEHRSERLLDFLGRALAAPRPPIPGLILPFALGFVGVFGYELRADLGSPVVTPSPLPDAELLFLDRAVVLDHMRGEAWLLALDHPENVEWLATMEARLGEPDVPVASLPPVAPALPTWRHDRADYRKRIMMAFEALRAGESYELCLTNEVRVRFTGSVRAAYGRLRRVNPAPFAALLELPSFALLSSSPERFLRVELDGGVRAEPIKGTRRRLADADADAAVRAELAAAEKDRAENLMIVDLLRHDLGRVCAPCTVDVPRLFGVDSFARVHQMVSHVTGRLRDGLGAVDALGAAFPPGSMTGAPKLRSMAILEALEGGPRGPYAGALGWLSLSGGADLSVVIRSAVIAGGEASIGVGGAIVALSVPDAEVAEMELKAEAVIEALQG